MVVLFSAGFLYLSPKKDKANELLSKTNHSWFRCSCRNCLAIPDRFGIYLYVYIYVFICYSLFGCSFVSLSCLENVQYSMETIHYASAIVSALSKLSITKEQKEVTHPQSFTHAHTPTYANAYTPPAAPACLPNPGRRSIEMDGIICRFPFFLDYVLPNLSPSHVLFVKTVRK